MRHQHQRRPPSPPTSRVARAASAGAAASSIVGWRAAGTSPTRGCQPGRRTARPTATRRLGQRSTGGRPDAPPSVSAGLVQRHRAAGLLGAGAHHDPGQHASRHDPERHPLDQPTDCEHREVRRQPGHNRPDDEHHATEQHDRSGRSGDDDPGRETADQPARPRTPRPATSRGWPSRPIRRGWSTSDGEIAPNPTETSTSAVSAIQYWYAERRPPLGGGARRRAGDGSPDMSPARSDEDEVTLEMIPSCKTLRVAPGTVDVLPPLGWSLTYSRGAAILAANGPRGWAYFAARAVPRSFRGAAPHDLGLALPTAQPWRPLRAVTLDLWGTLIDSRDPIGKIERRREMLLTAIRAAGHPLRAGGASGRLPGRAPHHRRRDRAGPPRRRAARPLGGADAPA